MNVSRTENRRLSFMREFVAVGQKKLFIERNTETKKSYISLFLSLSLCCLLYYLWTAIRFTPDSPVLVIDILILSH